MDNWQIFVRTKGFGLKSWIVDELLFFVHVAFCFTTDDVMYLWIIMFLSAVWTLILVAPIHSRGSFGELVVN